MNMGVFINRGSSRDPWGDYYVLVWLAGEHLRIVSGKCDEAVAGSRHGVARQTAGGSVCLSFCTLAGLCVLCICLPACLRMLPNARRNQLQSRRRYVATI